MTKSALPLALLLAAAPVGARADEATPVSQAAPASPAPAAMAPAEPVKPAHVVEVTFGTSQAFNGSAAQLMDAQTRVLPTTAATMLVEWLAGERWAVAALFNLPLGPSRVVTPEGKETWAVADAVGAVGLRVSPLQVPLLWNHGLFETQLGAFVGSPIGSPKGPTPVPILSGRLHLRNETGFAVYAGVSWAFVAESLVWTYGVGNRF